MRHCSPREAPATSSAVDAGSDIPSVFDVGDAVTVDETIAAAASASFAGCVGVDTSAVGEGIAAELSAENGAAD